MDPVLFWALVIAGCLVAALLAAARLRLPAAALTRVNFRGKEVPAVLGTPIVVAGITGVGALAVIENAEWRDGPPVEVLAATLVLLTVFGLAGAWDDRKGDERPRGFRGHLGALKTGRVTGGLVKLLSGGVAGLIAGWLVFQDLLPAIQTGLIVALAANLINLFDRAPGRAGKVCLLLGIPLLLAGDQGWALSVAASAGALLGVLAFDLRERGMLGDAGSNPLGALLGLGVALSLETSGRWVAAGTLFALNAASEKWSFSRIIGAVKPLNWLDQLGRRA